MIMIAKVPFTVCPYFRPEQSISTSLYVLLKHWNSTVVIDLQLR